MSSRYMCVSHNKMLYGIKNVNRHHFLFHEPTVGEEKIKPNERYELREYPQIQPSPVINQPSPRGWKQLTERKYQCPFPGCGKKLFNPQALTMHGRIHGKNYTMNDAIKIGTQVQQTPKLTARGRNREHYREYQRQYRAKKRQQLINSVMPAPQLIQPTMPNTNEHQEFVTQPTHQFQSPPTMDQILEAIKERGFIINQPILEKRPDPEPRKRGNYTKKLPCPYCVPQTMFLSTQSLKVHVIGKHEDKIMDFLKTPHTLAG